MSLFIEPGETTVEVAEEKIAVKILTARERVQLLRLGAEIAELGRTVDSEGDILPTTTATVQEKHLDILELAMIESPDKVSLPHWPALVTAIWRVNRMDGDDAKN